MWLNRLLPYAFKWQVNHVWQGYIPTRHGLAFGHVVEKTWRDRSNNPPRT
ncbi:MAG: hypothetical protein JWN04_3230 [Myxococcaceae bacterium]|nr:hypothetical protein [Myxococcaceae bacterium]